MAAVRDGVPWFLTAFTKMAGLAEVGSFVFAWADALINFSIYDGTAKAMP
jgi:hypothetical protein